MLVVPLHGDGSPVTWAGSISLQANASGVQPWRLPHTDADLLTVAGDELSTTGYTRWLNSIYYEIVSTYVSLLVLFIR